MPSTPAGTQPGFTAARPGPRTDWSTHQPPGPCRTGRLSQTLPLSAHGAGGGPPLIPLAGAKPRHGSFSTPAPAWSGRNVRHRFAARRTWTSADGAARSAHWCGRGPGPGADAAPLKAWLRRRNLPGAIGVTADVRESTKAWSLLAVLGTGGWTSHWRRKAPPKAELSLTGSTGSVRHAAREHPCLTFSSRAEVHR